MCLALKILRLSLNIAMLIYHLPNKYHCSLIGKTFGSYPKVKGSIPFSDTNNFYRNNMNTFKEIFENKLQEKTLSDADIKKMLDTIISKTKDAKEGSGKNMNKMATDMKSLDSLSPAQCGWAMKSMKVLAGN